MAHWWLLLVISAQVLEVALGGAVLRLLFINYRNPTEEDWKSHLCDAGGIGKCDHEFTFCIDKTAGTKHDDFGDCRIKQYKTSHYSNQNNIVFETNLNGGVHNPTHDVLSKWEGSVRLKVRVMDEDSGISGGDDLVDKLYKTLSMDRPYRSLEESEYIRPGNDVLRGTRSDDPTSMLMEWTVYCEENFFGADCATRCRATDYYTCDPDTGAKVCREGYESPGRDCKILSDDCYQNRDQCLNGATCVDGDQSFTCSCVEGYEGEFCETEINECVSSPCQNGGTCVDGIGQYTCDCSAVYVGQDCELHVCDQGVAHCQNGGTCINGGDCMCLKGYAGNLCQLDFCQVTYCLNGGTCHGSECHCVAGFTGTDCSVNLCDHIQCENGGTCTDGACVCLLGYSGKYCHLENNACKNNPCKNDGTCYNQRDTYQCRCLPAYTGADCETRLKPILNETIVTSPPFEDIDVTGSARGGDPNSEEVSDTDVGLPGWALAMVIALGILILIIILIVALLLKFRRRLSKAKREAAALESPGPAAVGNFSNPLYVPQHINNLHQERQNSQNEVWSTQGAMGGTEPTYAEPTVFKFPPSPANVNAHGNHYDVPPSKVQAGHGIGQADTTYENTTPSKMNNTDVKTGVFASVLDEEQAPPLPEKKGLP